MRSRPGTPPPRGPLLVVVFNFDGPSGAIDARWRWHGLAEAIATARTELARRGVQGEWAVIVDEKGLVRRRYVTDHRGIVRRKIPAPARGRDVSAKGTEALRLEEEEARADAAKGSVHAEGYADGIARALRALEEHRAAERRRRP